MHPGEKAVAVEVSEDELKVDLLDGRTIIVPWRGIPACYMQRRISARTGGSLGPVSVFIGRTSTRT
jgi:hypothetical protein